MSSLLRIGLMGFGFAGATFHAPVIATSGRTEVAAIATVSPIARRRRIRARVVPDLDTLLGLDDIECVVIATPNDTHFALARQVLEAGRHVVVDKPVTLTADEALALARLANARSRLFAPFHNRRWDGDFLTVRDIVKSGGGRITSFESHFDRFRPTPRTRWREEPARGGGLLLDLGPHLIDQALALFGLPETVSATVKTRRDNGTAPDFVHLQLGYPDKDVTLHASALSAIEPARFTLHGTRGSYQKFADTQEDQLKAGLTADDVDRRRQPARRAARARRRSRGRAPGADARWPVRGVLPRARRIDPRRRAVPRHRAGRRRRDDDHRARRAERARRPPAAVRAPHDLTPRAGRSRPAPMQRDQPEHSVTNAGERKSAADWSDAFLEKVDPTPIRQENVDATVDSRSSVLRPGFLACGLYRAAAAAGPPAPRRGRIRRSSRTSGCSRSRAGSTTCTAASMRA